MHNIFKKLTAVITSAVVSFSTISLLSVVGADDTAEKKVYTVTFDWEEEGVSVEKNSDGEIIPIENITAEENSYEFLPNSTLYKKGYKFQGWTADGIYGYEPGDLFHITNENVVLKPLFVDSSDTEYHTIEYYVEIDGEVVDTHLELRTYKYRQNQIVKVSSTAIANPNARQIGWQTNGYKFLPEQKIVMGTENIVLVPIWHYYHTLTYHAGDVSNIVGATYAIFDLQEGGKKELADSSRFSRIGYKITGWHCTLDDKDYPFLYSFTMPDEDVDFYAIWEPIEYNVVFSTGLSDVKSIKVRGFTDTVITVPEIPHSKEGYTFGGFLYNDKVYMPGDDFYIEGAMPGLGISLKAVWIDENVHEATTTTTISSTTSTITTTSATTLNNESVNYGDSNCDDKVNLSDAVIIMQAIANPSKYGTNGTDETHITKNGVLNSDVVGNDGMNNSDALVIQQFILNVVTSLPIISK